MPCLHDVAVTANPFTWADGLAMLALFAVAFGPIFYREYKRPPSEFDAHF